MAAISRVLSVLKPRRHRISSLARREAGWGLLFLSPWIIGFIAFYVLPMIASLVLSFTNFNLVSPEKVRFIGFDNYVQLVHDPDVRLSAWITIRFALISVPMSLIGPLAMAALLNAKNLWAKSVFRTFFYMPTIVPLISGIYVWRGFLNPITGWLNLALEKVGIPGPNWLHSIVWIYPALIIIGLWGYGNAMVTMLAGMQNVPTELYDAAHVDGAGPLYTFFKITVPMISPVIFYNLVLSLIGHFQYFTIAWVMGGPNSDPGRSTLFYNVHLYKEAFDRLNMGYGATLAWVLFVVALVVTVVLFGTAKYWVYYAAEE